MRSGASATSKPAQLADAVSAVVTLDLRSAAAMPLVSRALPVDESIVHMAVWHENAV